MRRIAANTIGLTLKACFRRARIPMVSLALVLAMQAAFAREPVVIDSVAKTERIKPGIKLSGGVVVAAMLMQSRPDIDLSEFHVVIPATPHARLCARIAAADAGYVAEPVYDLKGVVPGTYTLDFDSKEKSLLRSYDPEELVISAWTAERDCGFGPEGSLLIAGWGATSLARSLYIFINSGNAFAHVRRGACGEAEARIFKCDTIASDRARRLFDKSCKLEERYERKEIAACVELVDFEDSLGSAPFRLQPSPR